MSLIDLPWEIEPAARRRHGDALVVTAAARTDIFSSPFGSVRASSAARLLTDAPQGDWQLQARVRVGFRDSWDAGALLIWANEGNWAKLNFERAPEGKPAIFSVVTREGLSDDAVGWAPAAPDAGQWLRISYLDGAFAFHAAGGGTAHESHVGTAHQSDADGEGDADFEGGGDGEDGGDTSGDGGGGRSWRLVRQFALASTTRLLVGLLVQSPVGDGCEVTFDHVQLTGTRLPHLYDGR